jgi:putative acetyltransferase
MINFRLEGAGEADKIHDLVHQSFGQVAEAQLVTNLCNDGDALISVVAVDDEDNNIVGHILFSDTPVGTTRNLLRGAAMAPLSVAKTHQGQGIGGGLVMQGLRECRDKGIQVVVVLGAPDYYSRFGFSADIAKDLESPYEGEFFQALEIEPGILNGISGKVLYPNAFSKMA